MRPSRACGGRLIVHALDGRLAGTRRAVAVAQGADGGGAPGTRTGADRAQEALAGLEAAQPKRRSCTP
jgi:hypothetical protein